jgi:nucleolin
MTTEDARKLFVAGLPESMTEGVLRQLFEATGCTVIELSLPRDRTTGRPRGFGFVTLENIDQTERARSALDGSIQAGRSISVRPFQGATTRREPRAEAPPQTSTEDRTLYVGNLSYEATAEELQQVLAQAGVGTVARVHLPVGPDGRPRGFGFVTLGSADAVREAVSLLQDAELRGRRVMVKVAHPRGSGPAPSPRQPGEYGARPPMQSRGYQDAEPLPEPGPSRAYRPPEAAVDGEEEEDGDAAAVKKASAAGGKAGKAGKAAPAKRKGAGTAEERRNRGGGASWQRWDDRDKD